MKLMVFVLSVAFAIGTGAAAVVIKTAIANESTAATAAALWHSSTLKTANLP